MEVDALKMGGVLSHRNYDMGDQILLLFKLNTGPPLFLVWTEHRNLEYFYAAKRLHPPEERLDLLCNQLPVQVRETDSLST